MKIEANNLLAFGFRLFCLPCLIFIHQFFRGFFFFLLGVQNLCIFILFCFLKIVVLLELSQLFLCCSPVPHPSLLLYSIPTMLSMSKGHLYKLLDYTLPLLFTLILLTHLLWSLLVCSLWPLVLFCSFVCFVH